MHPYIKLLFTTIVLLFIATQSKAQKPAPDWKTYTNDKYGFAFQYPNTWIKDADSDIVVSGITRSRSVHFFDPISKSFLLLSYTLSKGKEIYDLYATNPSGGKRIKVDGNDAIEIITLDNKNGKGKLLNPKEISTEINVEFLDKKKTGEFELKFIAINNTALKTEENKFNRVVSSFKINK